MNNSGWMPQKVEPVEVNWAANGLLGTASPVKLANKQKNEQSQFNCSAYDAVLLRVTVSDLLVKDDNLQQIAVDLGPQSKTYLVLSAWTLPVDEDDGVLNNGVFLAAEPYGFEPARRTLLGRSRFQPRRDFKNALITGELPFYSDDGSLCASIYSTMARDARRLENDGVYAPLLELPVINGFPPMGLLWFNLDLVGVTKANGQDILTSFSAWVHPEVWGWIAP